ncbi:hypothetical protein HDV00_008473 [Rhizophlyctis rosea]|nr:hypothetical protein HDV00_008473 [Rhizophlyctis rosea]
MQPDYSDGLVVPGRLERWLSEVILKNGVMKPVRLTGAEKKARDSLFSRRRRAKKKAIKEGLPEDTYTNELPRVTELEYVREDIKYRNLEQHIKPIVDLQKLQMELGLISKG